mgnify:CR=1 FL=1
MSDHRRRASLATVYKPGGTIGLLALALADARSTRAMWWRMLARADILSETARARIHRSALCCGCSSADGARPDAAAAAEKLKLAQPTAGMRSLAARGSDSSNRLTTFAFHAMYAST